METIQQITTRYHLLEQLLDERNRRLLAAAEAQVLGHGGISLVSKATGLSRKAIGKGLAELSAPPLERLPSGRIRRAGAGRKPLTTHQPGVKTALERLVEPTTRGDPESPLRWTCKSVRRLSEELGNQGHSICPQKVADLLHELGYSLQANRKVLEGASHPDRDGQFRHLQAAVQQALAGGEPVISVDAKKKELVGQYRNGGREWDPQGEPTSVKVYDYVDPAWGRAAPYGVYDIGRNAGWVSVGMDHDTAQFAAETIRRWWTRMGSGYYPGAHRLLITADGGGSNGSRTRLWKVELQRFADDSGLTISVCHLPPGTSKWNKIEHRLFSYITENWRGRPLTSYSVIVNLIANTRTATGLTVACQIDDTLYDTGVKVSDDEFAQLNITREAFHGEWNYTIAPRSGIR
jgi:hypothetical protein